MKDQQHQRGKTTILLTRSGRKFDLNKKVEFIKNIRNDKLNLVLKCI